MQLEDEMIGNSGMEIRYCFLTLGLARSATKVVVMDIYIN